MYPRIISLNKTLERKSLFLLGPRQTGKSTYLKSNYADAHIINLLEADTFRRYSSKPELLRQELNEHTQLLVIDEIQKAPQLLDEVHNLIEINKQLRFILTGSSARKLIRGKANMLAGRASRKFMFPLCSKELEFQHINKMLNYGSLPSIIDSPAPIEDLNDYIGIYLKEEIFNESLTRSIELFSHFLESTAFSNAEQINYTKIGNDCGIPPRTVRDHFQILYDTMMAHELTPLKLKQKNSRKTVSISKFYFFDIGVANRLAGNRDIHNSPEQLGKSLEHLIFLELLTYKNYRNSELKINFWRTQAKQEVDFVLNRSIAIEVKASSKIQKKHCKSLQLLSNETQLEKKIIVCFEKKQLTLENGIKVYPVHEFLKALWEGEIVS